MISRVTRGCGWALIGLAAAPLLVPAALGGRTAGLDQAAVVLMCLLAICACGLLAVTSHSSPLTATTVALATGGGIVTGLSIFALMPFERAGAALAGRVPADLGWAGVGVVAVVVPIVVLIKAEQGGPGQSAYALWHLSGVAALTVFVTAVVAIRFFPAAIPDIVPASIVWQGDGPAKAVEYARAQSAVEAIDPYVLPLLVATLLLGTQGLLTTARSLIRPGGFWPNTRPTPAGPPGEQEDRLHSAGR